MPKIGMFFDTQCNVPYSYQMWVRVLKSVPVSPCPLCPCCGPGLLCYSGSCASCGPELSVYLWISDTSDL